MAIELVTGHSGETHISGEDVGALIAGAAGSGSYSLGSAPVPQMLTTTSLSIPACDIVIQGRHVRLTGSNIVGIDSGVQSGSRIDLVYLEYAYDAGTGVESVSGPKVAKGATAAKASAPSLPHGGSILDRAGTVDVAIARVDVTNLSPRATWLLPVLPTLTSLEGRIDSGPFHGYMDDIDAENKTDSWVPVLTASSASGSGRVQHRVLSASLGKVGIWGGSAIGKFSGTDFQLMNYVEFKQLTGEDLDQSHFFVGVCSGDDDMARCLMTASIQYNSVLRRANAIIVKTSAALDGRVNHRINYAIVRWA